MSNKKVCEWKGCSKPAEGVIDVTIKKGKKKSKLHYCEEHFYKFKEEYQRRYSN